MASIPPSVRRRRPVHPATPKTAALVTGGVSSEAALPAPKSPTDSKKSTEWRALSAFVPGSGHLERGTPCQDRAGAWTSPRPALIVLDGRGSSALSHEGAEAALVALRKEIETLEDSLRASLDEDDDDGLAALSWQGLAQWLYTVAARSQRELASASGRPTLDYEFTLSLAIGGTRRTAWMAVGDSPLVACRSGILFLPCHLETSEFANQTRFVQASPGRSLGLSGGLLPTEDLELLAAMSDGTATRLVDLRGQVAADAVRELGSLLARGELDEPTMVSLLEEGDWSEFTRDDRCLALLARNAAETSPSPNPNPELCPEVQSLRCRPVAETETTPPCQTQSASEASPRFALRTLPPRRFALAALAVVSILAAGLVLHSVAPPARGRGGSDPGGGGPRGRGFQRAGSHRGGRARVDA